jgi:hypothetical protein
MHTCYVVVTSQAQSAQRAAVITPDVSEPVGYRNPTPHRSRTTLGSKTPDSTLITLSAYPNKVSRHPADQINGK